ncbi:unnamed protein product [Paramecium octaurelia]|uniref:RING-type domain-containing protein n=1 Tax=Paramecium octaurelia TaxID=43137 RepID=A0A8S1U3C4_PAROT|nr:unnamed protein product [Paramecium octaurelia]
MKFFNNSLIQLSNKDLYLLNRLTIQKIVDLTSSFWQYKKGYKKIDNLYGTTWSQPEQYDKYIWPLAFFKIFFNRIINSQYLNVRFLFKNNYIEKMWKFQKIFWILPFIQLSLLQQIQDIYNVSENKFYKGIWTLEDKNHKIDAHQVQGLVKFSHNSIIYKGFSNNDQQDEQFYGDISLNVKLFSIALKGIGNTHIKADNAYIQCKNEFTIEIQVDNNTKTVCDRQLIVIFQSSNHKLPQCNQLLKFTTQASNEENQIQLIITENITLIFFIYQLVLPFIFRKFVLHKKMKLSQLSLIALFIYFEDLVFIYALIFNFDVYFNNNINLAIFIIYILQCIVLFGFASYFLEEKGKNCKIKKNHPWTSLPIVLCVIIGICAATIFMAFLCFYFLFFQLIYALVLFPQVIHNIRWNSIEKFNLFYLFGCLSSGLPFSTYLQFYLRSINSLEFDYLFIILFYGIYLISLLLLYLQYKYGSRCVIPKWILNKYYQDCAICMDSILIADMENQLLFSPVILTQCQHKFHEKCLREWLLQREDCPLCRTKLDEMQ